jgi:hypothetical protein
MKVAELYLKCLDCGRIPDWTTTVETVNDATGETVKHYTFDKQCSCGGGSFEVVEVRSGNLSQVR